MEVTRFEIDPVKYGVLWQKVESYEAKFDEMSKKIDKMENSIDQLVAMANKGRGGFWVLLMVISGISSFVGFIGHYLSSK